jgi:hypothetical protein
MTELLSGELMGFAALNPSYISRFRGTRSRTRELTAIEKMRIFAAAPGSVGAADRRPASRRRDGPYR